MQEIQLSLISPSPNPIRKSWDEGKMQELAQSIKEQGVIVPIKVRPANENAELMIGFVEKYGSESNFWAGAPNWDDPVYEVVYGHRRVEAAKRAGLEDIPAIIEDILDSRVRPQALTENKVREDMTHIDVAIALQSEIDEKGLSKDDVGKPYGMSRIVVHEYLKMLDPMFEGIIKDFPENITHKHVSDAYRARDGAADVLRKTIAEDLSKRETRAVADAYVAADTPELKQAILQVDAKVAKTPEQITFTARAMGKGEAYSDFQEKKRAQKKRDVMEGFDRAVKTFLDFTKDYGETVKMAQETARFGRFSPEAKKFAVRRLTSLMDDLQVLLDELGE